MSFPAGQRPHLQARLETKVDLRAHVRELQLHQLIARQRGSELLTVYRGQENTSDTTRKLSLTLQRSQNTTRHIKTRTSGLLARDKTGQGKARQKETTEDNRRQDKTRQDKIRQDKTRQDKKN
jgi:hypothetical protein